MEPTKPQPEQNTEPTPSPAEPVQTAQPLPQPPVSTPAATPSVSPDDPHAKADAMLAQHKTHRTPVAAVILAIIIALGIAGLVVFVYWRTQNDTEPIADTDAATTTTETETVTPATTTDVDDTTQAIDEALDAVNDTEDFSESELSDDSLGL